MNDGSYNGVMKYFLFGRSQNGLAIDAISFGSTGKHVLIVGGVHGDEIEGVALVKFLVAELSENLDFPLKVTLVPCLNIDGFLAGTRQNANDVDLNRNLPTADWNPTAFNDRYSPGDMANSELENKALVEFIKTQRIDFILSLHSFSRSLLNVNGNCEPVSSLISDLTGLPVEESIGYPTPGCLGTYAGLERNIPTITYELPRGSDIREIIKLHGESIKEALKVYASC